MKFKSYINYNQIYIFIFLFSCILMMCSYALLEKNQDLFDLSHVFPSAMVTEIFFVQCGYV